MKYYELRDDIYYPRRWHLGEIIDVEDNWQFIYGEKINAALLPKNVHIELYEEGIPLDYTTTEAFNVPIVSERIKTQLGDVEGLQFIPVNINSREADSTFYILVVTIKIDCVDEKLSEFELFKEDDPIRPDLAGHYSWFTKLVVDEEKIKGKDIFRINKTGTYLIVSERIKDAIEDINAIGFTFSEV